MSLHSKTLPSHNPRAKDGLRAVYYVRTCQVFTSGSVRGGTWVVQVWNGYGTVWNGVWKETAHSSTALPPRSTSLSKFAVWSENSAASNSLTASWQQPSASLQSNTTAVPQPAATLSGAGTNLPQVEREGGLQAIHS